MNADDRDAFDLGLPWGELVAALLAIVLLCAVVEGVVR